jgi:hypothetical protein
VSALLLVVLRDAVLTVVPECAFDLVVSKRSTVVESYDNEHQSDRLFAGTLRSLSASHRLSSTATATSIQAATTPSTVIRKQIDYRQ